MTCRETQEVCQKLSEPSIMTCCDRAVFSSGCTCNLLLFPTRNAPVKEETTNARTMRLGNIYARPRFLASPCCLPVVCCSYVNFDSAFLGNASNECNIKGENTRDSPSYAVSADPHDDNVHTYVHTYIYIPREWPSDRLHKGT